MVGRFVELQKEIHSFSQIRAVFLQSMAVLSHFILDGLLQVQDRLGPVVQPLIDLFRILSGFAFAGKPNAKPLIFNLATICVIGKFSVRCLASSYVRL